jgi:hypothetical protein
MSDNRDKRPRWALAAGAFVIAFGILTIFSGGRALFGGVAARAAVGDAVPFVLWFNFLAGFAYVVAGAGLIVWRRWAVFLAAGIAVATLAVFIAFAGHVLAGGAYEMRTVGAMSLRSLVWLAVAWASLRAFARRAPSAGTDTA